MHADYNEKRDKKWTQRQEIFMQRTRCKNLTAWFLFIHVDCVTCEMIFLYQNVSPFSKLTIDLKEVFIYFKETFCDHFVTKLFFPQGFNDVYKEHMEKTWSERKEQFGVRQKCKFVTNDHPSVHFHNHSFMLCKLWQTII